MTTDADTGQQIDAASVWRAVGRLEGKMDALENGQRETNQRIDHVDQRVDHLGQRLDHVSQRLDYVSQRVDRLFYAILAVGGGLLAAMLVTRFVGN